VDLFGAPYDGRVILDSDVLNKWMNQTKELIEFAYARNGYKKKIALMGHGFGCLLTHAFLIKQSQAWKDKYIIKYISVAGPYGGIPKALRTVIGGSVPDGSKQVPTLTGVGGSMAAMYWLLPKEDLFGNMEILKVGNKVYKTRSYDDFFESIGKKQQYLDSVPHREIFNKPNGSNNEIVIPFFAETETQYIYNKGLDQEPETLPESVFYKLLQDEGRWPSVVFNPNSTVGDSTVPFLSLYLPVMRWTDGSVYRLQPINASHSECIRDPTFYSYIIWTLHRKGSLNITD
jgi:hypothetical protein